MKHVMVVPCVKSYYIRVGLHKLEPYGARLLLELGVCHNNIYLPHLVEELKPQNRKMLELKGLKSIKNFFYF